MKTGLATENTERTEKLWEEIIEAKIHEAAVATFGVPVIPKEFVLPDSRAERTSSASVPSVAKTNSPPGGSR